MSTYGYTNPFTVSFTSMKLRYVDYDSSIEQLNFVNRDDKVNVFINFESVLNNLSMIKDLDNKILLERAYPIILESEAINLCAHYKKFFKGNGLQCRVFLYYTDLSSDNFKNFKYNPEYRSYYMNKYLQNPKFQVLGKKIVDAIVPRISKIMEFIPDVYFINCTGIEGSLVPFIISKQDESYKNFIISMDKYETQYQLHDKNFCMHYIKRSPLGSSVFCSFDKYIYDLFKENSEDNADIALFNNSSFYSVLLSAIGDKPRSIDPLKGIGCKSIMKYILSGISSGLITTNTNSLDMILQSLPEEQRQETTENFNCISIEKQYDELSQQDIFNITNQIIDRCDYLSLEQLNREIYKNYPLMLPELTC